MPGINGRALIFPIKGLPILVESYKCLCPNPCPPSASLSVWTEPPESRNASAIVVRRVNEKFTEWRNVEGKTVCANQNMSVLMCVQVKAIMRRLRFCEFSRYRFRFGQDSHLSTVKCSCAYIFLNWRGKACTFHPNDTAGTGTAERSRNPAVSTQK